MNTKSIITLAALTLAGSAALAQQVSTAGAEPGATVTVKAARFSGAISETEGLLPSSSQAPSGLTRAQVEAEVIAAREAGQSPFVNEVDGYRLAAAQRFTGLTRAEVRAEVLREPHGTFASLYHGG